MISKRNFLFLLFCLFPFFSFSQTQNFSIVQYTTKEGLANNTVYNVLQDKNGFIWIGTENGLSRYDGYEFVNFFSNQPDSSTISNNYCTRLAEDTAGYIWVSTLSGLNRIDPHTLSVKRFYNIIPSNTGKGSTEGYIVKDRKGNIFYRGQHDIMKWNYVNQLFEPFYPEILNAYRDSTGDIFGIFLDSKNRYWISYRLGLRLLDVNNKKLINVMDAKEGTNIQDILETPDGDFFLATWSKHLIRFNPQTFQKQIFLSNDTSWKNNSIIQSLNYIKGANGSYTLLFSINDFGIGKYDFHQNIFQKISFDKLPVFKNEQSVITFLFTDRQQNTWCASDNGLYKIINRPADILNYEFTFLTTQNQEAEIIQRFNSELSDELIIRNAKQELYQFNPSTGKHQLIDEIKCSNKKIKLKPVYLFSVDRLNRLWIFTDNQDIICWDKNADTLFSIHHSLGKDVSGYKLEYNSAYTDRNGKVWIATWGGLYYLQNGEVKKFDFSDEVKKYGQQFSSSVGRITEDKNGCLWIARRFSWEGKKAAITRINTSDNSYETFFKDHKPGSITTDNDFFDIAIDSKNQVWIANVNGLITCNAADKKPVFSSVQQEAPFNYGLVNKLILLKDTLVIYSRSGIFLLNTTSGSVIRKYDERDGVFSFNELYSINKLAGSRLLLNYGKFFQVLDLSTHEYSSSLSKPLLVSVKIKENDFVEYKSKTGIAPFVDEVIMQPGIHDVVFKFTANDFSDGINRMFTWKLDGFENSWSVPVYSNRISYNNLEPGNYTFLLKVVDRYGSAGEELKIPVVVKPFFYQTLWFKILIFILIAIGVYLLFRYRVNRIKKEEAQKTIFNKQLAELEMQALRAQMNPHFLFNCLNSIQRFILENENKIAITYLAKFARLVRLILENSRDKKVALSKEIESLDLYIQMEKLRFDHNFSYSINVDKTIDTEFTFITPMLLQPYVENSIWHGVQHKEGDGKITIHISEKNNSLEFAVEDNGIGRKASAAINSNRRKHNSVGLQITEKRIEMLSNNNQNGTVKIIDLYDSEIAVGTRVEINLPLE